MTGNHKAVRVRITGRVQGVGFRDWTLTQASQLGLTGWVRNERDGSVTALVAGSDDTVAAMLEHFWNGPRFASVSDVGSETIVLSETPADFRIAG